MKSWTETNFLTALWILAIVCYLFNINNVITNSTWDSKLGKVGFLIGLMEIHYQAMSAVFANSFVFYRVLIQANHLFIEQ